jgi:tetratricopeptide (TPR) repeat protein
MYTANGANPETAEELLARAGRRIREDLSKHPLVRAKLLETIGRAYRRRGDDKSAVSFLQDAVQIRTSLSGGQGDAATAAAMVDLAMTMREGGDVLASDGVLLGARDILQRVDQQHSVTYARMLANRGRVQMKLGKPDAAQAFYNQALALQQDLNLPRDPETAALLVDKSVAFIWQDDPLSAERSARSALEIYATALPKLHPDRTSAQSALGEALRLQGRLDEASVLLKEALVANRTIYGENGRPVADNLDALAKVRLSQHDLSEAEKFAQEALDTQIRAEGLDHWRTAFYRISLGAIQSGRKEYPAAEAQLRSAIATLQKSFPADHPYVASAEHYLGEVLLGTNRLKDAEAVFMAAMNRSKRANEPGWRAARSASGLGEALYRQGRAREAEPYLVNSFRALSADNNADATAQALARERVVRFYTDRGQTEKLHALTEEARPGNSSAASRND